VVLEDDEVEPDDVRQLRELEHVADPRGEGRDERPEPQLTSVVGHP
jgi:hypothetical protein